jgi:phospholipase/carboxylesterase
MLPLADAFGRNDIAYVAPQAAGHTWYPLSFLAPFEANEPHLSSALALIAVLVADLEAKGFPPDKTGLVGFSQGACLASEFAARNARRYGFVAALTGGLIGPPGTPRDYAGSLAGTPVFIGSSDIDPHVPLQRVHETTAVLSGLGAEVDERIYPGMGHTVNDDEIAAVIALLNRMSSSKGREHGSSADEPAHLINLIPASQSPTTLPLTALRWRDRVDRRFTGRAGGARGEHRSVSAGRAPGGPDTSARPALRPVRR